MKIVGRYKFRRSDGRESRWYTNLIMLGDGTGMNLLLRQLAHNTAFGIAITHIKLGLGTTPPDDSDTDLEIPTTPEIVVTQRTLTGADEAEFKFFATDLQVPDDTYNEIGLYVGDQLFARSIISPAYEKDPGVDTTVVYTITVAN